MFAFFFFYFFFTAYYRENIIFKDFKGFSIIKNKYKNGKRDWEVFAIDIEGQNITMNLLVAYDITKILLFTHTHSSWFTCCDNYFNLFLFLFNFFFFRNKHSHTKVREISFNIKAHYKLHLKAMVTFKGVWSKLYYTKHILLNNVG